MLVVDDLQWADYVFVSAMIAHKASAHEVAQHCAALGKPVLAGGPLFTTGHAAFPEIGHFVLGEAEERTVDTALSNTFGFGGHNAIAVLRRYNR